MPNTDQGFWLNWATFGKGKRRQDASSDLSIFVGDLASDVNDIILHETFATRYQSVRCAKVVDTNTGCSKGYGFVRFGDENERSRAMSEMNGQYCSSRPMHIGVATPKKPSAHQQYSTQGLRYWPAGLLQMVLCIKAPSLRVIHLTQQYLLEALILMKNSDRPFPNSARWFL